MSTRPPAARPPAAPRPAPLLDEVLGRTGSLLASGLPAPTGSVNYGAAGIAYALHRIATVRDDPELLATADVWAARAVAAVGDDAAFRSADLDIGPETVGVVSPFHTASGTYAVRALVSHASGEPGERSAAVEAFVRHSRRAETRLDLTLGRSGTLLAGALLLPVARDHAGLRDLGDDTAAGLLEEIRAPAAVADARYLGVAHGWAGVLFALLSWHRARRTPPPTTVVDRLAELAALAEPSGSGLRWPTSGRGAAGGLPRYLSGWCHGTAGYVQLWSVAYAMLADERHLALAEGAGRHTAAAADGAGNLCCGEAGQAYALLHLHRTTGDAHWLTAAKEQARRAVEHRDRARPAHSLYKGEVGVAVLLADLARPSTARMPFFEDEGW
ncbi:lanthionine synthetase LanC family protein [Asanoa ferruginea]|uniref:lanthionine synthetase LanC family protein n=1 Tax=Asanoa ferruginea TaxID=53367 RepID=UPI001FD6230E|nr:lanthionine synthetase LanC family protein [Asanoa ferruginea]